MNSRRRKLAWGAALTVAIAGGAWLRLNGLVDAPLYGDEYHGARVASGELGPVYRTFDERGTHIPLPLLQLALALTFEPGMLTFRLPAAVAGILTLIAFYPVARPLVGRAPALVGTFALAASPMLVYYSRFGRAYAITVFLSLLLTGLVHRAGVREWRGPGLLAAVLLTATLLPWTHLSSAGLVAALGLASIGLAWSKSGDFRAALRPGVVFAVAAALVVLLFLPVFEQVLDYTERDPDQSSYRPSGLLGIVLLLAGGGVEATVWLVGVPVALVGLWRSERTGAVLLATSILGPLALLLATMPHGMEYAYARYLINSLPAMVMLVAWFVVKPLARLVGEGAAAVVGIALVCTSFVAGPAARQADHGGFSNTYLAMRSLQAFDEPFVSTPEIYRTIAADDGATRIIEAPILQTRTVLMYRNYALQHGKEVQIGLITAPDDVRLNGPYTYLGSPALGKKSGAQYLVVHIDLREELEAFWLDVFDRSYPKFESVWDRGLMERHRAFYLPAADPKAEVAPMLAPLRRQLGEPFYEDDYVVVWKLRRSRAGARGQ